MKLLFKQLILFIIFWIGLMGFNGLSHHYYLSFISIVSAYLLSCHFDLLLVNDFSFLRMISYITRIACEITKSAIKVTKIIWMDNFNLNSSVVKIKHNQISEIAKTIYANNITLTPGTVVIDVLDDELLVHVLDDNSDILKVE